MFNTSMFTRIYITQDKTQPTHHVFNRLFETPLQHQHRDLVSNLIIPINSHRLFASFKCLSSNFARVPSAFRSSSPLPSSRLSPSLSPCVCVYTHPHTHTCTISLQSIHTHQTHARSTRQAQHMGINMEDHILSIQDTDGHLLCVSHSSLAWQSISLTLTGFSITMTDTYKYLGFILHKQLRWDAHIKELIHKATPTLYQIARLASYCASVAMSFAADTQCST